MDASRFFDFGPAGSPVEAGATGVSTEAYTAARGYGWLAGPVETRDRGAPTNLPDDDAWATPLSWAIRRGHTSIEALLRAAGAVT